MSEPVIRKRERAAPPRPVSWPNGSGFYTQGGAGKAEQQYGWTVKRDGKYQAYRRTGPADADFEHIGAYVDFSAALTALSAKPPWSKSTASRARAPSPPPPPAPEPRIRQRVRPPLDG